MIKNLARLGALALMTMLPSAAAVLNFDPSVTNVNVGDNFTIDITITDVTDLYSWEIGTISFGPVGLLNATGVTEGSFLGAGTTFGGGVIDNGAATITILFSSLSGASGVTGSGILAQIAFTAIAEGVVTLSMADILLGDSFLDPINFDPSGTASITIGQNNNVVPEPSTYAFLGMGVAALAYARRRK